MYNTARMHIDIHAKNIELNVPLRTFIEEKIGDLEATLSSLGETSARVEVSIPSKHLVSGDIFAAEANITSPGQLFRAEAKHHDLHAAIVEVKDDLKNQINRFKDKMRQDSRRPLE